MRYCAARRESNAVETVKELNAASTDLAGGSSLAHTKPFLEDFDCMAKVIDTSQSRSSKGQAVQCKRLVNTAFLQGQARAIGRMLPSATGRKRFFGVKRFLDRTSHFMTLNSDRKFKRVCGKLGVDPSCLRALKKRRTGT